MSETQNYGGTFTKLVSSYAWDTAIDFIQKVDSDNEHSDYATISPEGNYSDIEFDYVDLKETDRNSKKEMNENILVPTGQTTAVSNIYDMGGNLLEYTTERYSDNNVPYVTRGGCYDYHSEHIPAGYRSLNVGGAYNITGFRVTLYVK